MAQPTPLPAPPPTPDPVPAEAPAEPVAAPPPAPVVDEAMVRVLVDREVARILNERAVREAADKAAAEAAAAPAPQGNIRGASGFVDARLAFTLTNENILAKPGETIPSVPGWRFGRPNSLGTLFFDNYDTRFSGYETLSHAVLYRNYRRDHLEVEGALVFRINEITERQLDLSDAGSYILTSWWKDPKHEDPTRATLTVFPVSADRFRLGYSYRLSWGGNDEYRRSRRSIPGLKFQVDDGKYYAFVGAKSTVVLNPATAEEESVFAGLIGAGADVTPKVRIEANGGYFDRGNNELEDVNTETVQLYGASVQVAVHDGMPVQSSIDYKLYKNDGERIGQLFKKQAYPGGISWLAMSEATLLAQTLKDPEKSGSTTVQTGFAGDLNVRLLVDRYRIRFDAQYRDLAYILHSVPSLPTYSEFPEAYAKDPNLFAAVGVDRNWQDRLTVGAVVGIELPATLKTPAGIPGDTAASGESTAVIRNNGQQTIITVLPAGETAVPQFAFKASGQLDFGDIYAALVDVYYSFDGNQTRLKRNGPEGLFEYEFGEFNQLGMNVTLQAKF
ncbi:MAG: hypothetical protein R3B48_11730 [Kofleriaceae bacterium]